MANDTERLKVKVKFYFENNIPCHVKLKPRGFVNVIVKSELINDTYFWVERVFDNFKYRLFAVDVFDLIDYKDNRKEGNT